MRAGVSTTWYTWLEQGRDIKPGPELLDAVCRTLQCDDDERRYVRWLAQCPVFEPYERSSPPDPSLIDLLNDLLPNPACLTTESYDLLAWNDAYATVLADPEKYPPERRNVILLGFLAPEVRRRTVGWSNAAKAGIAFARVEAAKHPDNERFREMIALLREESDEFRAAWELQEVRQQPHLEHVLAHEQVGEVRLQIMQLTLSSAQPTHVIVFQPSNGESRARLEQWLALDGLQD